MANSEKRLATLAINMRNVLVVICWAMLAHADGIPCHKSNSQIHTPHEATTRIKTVGILELKSERPILRSVFDPLAYVHNVETVSIRSANNIQTSDIIYIRNEDNSYIAFNERGNNLLWPMSEKHPIWNKVVYYAGTHFGDGTVIPPNEAQLLDVAILQALAKHEPSMALPGLDIFTFDYCSNIVQLFVAVCMRLCFVLLFFESPFMHATISMDFVAFVFVAL